MLVNRAKADEAAAILGLDLISVLEEADVARAYRDAAKQAHPDAGGSPEAFARVDWAKHALLAWLKRLEQAPPPAQAKQACQRCEGLGHVISPGAKPGSPGLRRTCPLCKGSGDADLDTHP